MNQKTRLKKLIEVLVENVLCEQDETNKNDSEGLDLSGSDSSEQDSDLGLDLGTSASGDETMSGSDATDSAADPESTLDDEGTSDLGGSDSGGFGGFGHRGSSGGGSSGFSGGSSDLSSDEETITTTDEVEDTNTLMQKLVPDDPTQETINMAIELSGKIGNTQDIVNAIKSNIQKYYENIEDSVEIVQGLWDTGNPKLRSVATKLLMFIKGD